MRHCHRVVTILQGIIKYRLGLCISRRGGGGGGGGEGFALCSAESGDQFNWEKLITNLLLPCILPT